MQQWELLSLYLMDTSEVFRAEHAPNHPRRLYIVPPDPIADTHAYHTIRREAAALAQDGWELISVLPNDPNREGVIEEWIFKRLR